MESVIERVRQDSERGALDLGRPSRILSALECWWDAGMQVSRERLTLRKPVPLFGTCI